ncbi:hypothetical protein CALCODRAFT_40559 [Calocera cornea HHB12733]|uniref:F-box domain-containing protein n=1 Tax=Calocera cornea HHB12733 TaxID=1353952 RepID=A0A165DWK6_9BASI|nr:hypothetical protein CALCODRAFT_40559 [Calocera cornea HHB12733]
MPKSAASYPAQADITAKHHHIWDIPELVQWIMAHMDHGTLYSAILTCRAWFEPAASVLWEKVSDRQLVFGAQTRWNEGVFTHGSSAYDVSIMRYTRFVRWFCIQRDIDNAPREALKRLFCYRRHKSVFPNLRIASLEMPQVFRRDYSTRAALDQRDIFFACLSPSVTKVILSLTPNAVAQHDYLRSLIGGILSAVPLLQAIQIRLQRALTHHSGTLFMESMAPLSQQALGPYFEKGSFDSLRSFSADLWTLDSCMRQSLAGLPNLEVLRIKTLRDRLRTGCCPDCEHYMALIERSLTSAPTLTSAPPNLHGSRRTFPALQVLELGGTSAPLMQVIALTSSVVELSIEVHSISVVELISLIGAHCPELQVLSLSQTRWTGDLTDRAFTGRKLETFRGCHKIRSLALRLDCCFDDDSLVWICDIWPGIASLTLDDRGRSRITTNGLRTLLTRCHNINEFSLRVAFPQRIVQWSMRTLDPVLTKDRAGGGSLHLGTTVPLPGTRDKPATQRHITFRPLVSLVLSNPDVVAPLLYSICPNLHIRADNGLDWEKIAQTLEDWRN